MLFPQNKKYSPALRIVALVLVFTFSWTSISFSAPDTFKPGTLGSVPNGAGLDFDQLIPESLGRVSEVFIPNGQVASSKGQGSFLDPGPMTLAPMVFYIQDAHANLGAQQNIQKIARLISDKFGVRTILAEGASGTADLSSFREYPNQKVKELATQFWLEQVILTGIEAEAVLNPKSYELIGAEDAALYDLNRKEFLKALEAQKELLPAVHSLIKENQRAKEKTYNKRLLEFETKTGLYEQRGELISLISYLTNIGRNEGVKRSDLHEIEKLISLVLLEKANGSRHSERSEESKSVDPSAPPQDDNDQRRQFEKISREIGAVNLFREIGLFKGRVRERLFSGKNEQALHEEGEYLNSVKALISLQATPEDFLFYQQHKKEITKFLKGKLDPEKFNAAEQFYVTSKKRDDVFLNSVKRYALSDKSDLTPNAYPSPPGSGIILVTGGFHAEDLTEKFRKENIPFILISPQVSPETDYDRYYERMNGETPAFEKLKPKFEGFVKSSAISNPLQSFNPKFNPQPYFDLAKSVDENFARSELRKSKFEGKFEVVVVSLMSAMFGLFGVAVYLESAEKKSREKAAEVALKEEITLKAAPEEKERALKVASDEEVLIEEIYDDLIVTVLENDPYRPQKFRDRDAKFDEYRKKVELGLISEKLQRSVVQEILFQYGLEVSQHERDAIEWRLIYGKNSFYSVYPAVFYDAVEEAMASSYSYEKLGLIKALRLINSEEDPKATELLIILSNDPDPDIAGIAKEALPQEPTITSTRSELRSIRGSIPRDPGEYSRPPALNRRLSPPYVLQPDGTYQLAPSIPNDFSHPETLDTVNVRKLLENEPHTNRTKLPGWRITESQIRELENWLLPSNPKLLPDSLALKKLWMHLLYQRQWSTQPKGALASNVRSNLDDWLGLLSKKWRLNPNQLSDLLLWFLNIGVPLRVFNQKISAEALYAFLTAYLNVYRIYNHQARTHFEYALPPDASGDQKLNLAAQNMQRMTSLFSTQMIRGHSILKAPIEGTPYYLNIRFGLYEDPFGFYVYFTEEGKSDAGVFARLGADTQSDDLRIIMLQGVAHKIHHFPPEFKEALGIHPIRALMYALLEFANQKGGFQNIIGVHANHQPRDHKDTRLDYESNFKGFGLRRHSPIGLWQSVEHLNQLTQERLTGKHAKQAGQTPEETARMTSGMNKIIDAVRNLQEVEFQPAVPGVPESEVERSELRIYDERLNSLKSQLSGLKNQLMREGLNDLTFSVRIFNHQETILEIIHALSKDHVESQKKELRTLKQLYGDFALDLLKQNRLTETLPLLALFAQRLDAGNEKIKEILLANQKVNILSFAWSRWHGAWSSMLSRFLPKGQTMSSFFKFGVWFISADVAVVGLFAYIGLIYRLYLIDGASVKIILLNSMSVLAVSTGILYLIYDWSKSQRNWKLVNQKLINIIDQNGNIEDEDWGTPRSELRNPGEEIVSKGSKNLVRRVFRGIVFVFKPDDFYSAANSLRKHFDTDEDVAMKIEAEKRKFTLKIDRYINETPADQEEWLKILNDLKEYVLQEIGNQELKADYLFEEKAHEWTNTFGYFFRNFFWSATHRTLSKRLSEFAAEFTKPEKLEPLQVKEQLELYRAALKILDINLQSKAQELQQKGRTKDSKAIEATRRMFLSFAQNIIKIIEQEKIHAAVLLREALHPEPEGRYQAEGAAFPVYVEYMQGMIKTLKKPAKTPSERQIHAQYREILSDFYRLLSLLSYGNSFGMPGMSSKVFRWKVLRNKQLLTESIAAVKAKIIDAVPTENVPEGFTASDLLSRLEADVLSRIQSRHQFADLAFQYATNSLLQRIDQKMKEPGISTEASNALKHVREIMVAGFNELSTKINRRFIANKRFRKERGKDLIVVIQGSEKQPYLQGGMSIPIIFDLKEAYPNLGAVAVEDGSPTEHWAIVASNHRILTLTSLKTKKGKFSDIKSGATAYADGEDGSFVANPISDTVKEKERKIVIEKTFMTLANRQVRRPARALKNGAPAVSISVDGTADGVEHAEVLRRQTPSIRLLRTETGIMPNFFKHALLADNIRDYRERFTSLIIAISRFMKGVFAIRAFDFQPDKEGVLGLEPGEVKYGFEFYKTEKGEGILRAQMHGTILAALERAKEPVPQNGRNNKKPPEFRFYLPMVHNEKEAEWAREIWEQEKAVFLPELERYGIQIPFGIMVETKAVLDRLPEVVNKKYVDFISIGTNDLLRENFNIDRASSDPALTEIRAMFLQEIEKIVAQAAANDIEVSICGEMAGWRRFMLFLIYLGGKYPNAKISVAVTAAVLPTLKMLVRHTHFEEAADIFDQLEYWIPDEERERAERQDKERKGEVDPANGLSDLLREKVQEIEERIHKTDDFKALFAEVSSRRRSELRAKHPAVNQRRKAGLINKKVLILRPGEAFSIVRDGIVRPNVANFVLQNDGRGVQPKILASTHKLFVISKSAYERKRGKEWARMSADLKKDDFAQDTELIPGKNYAVVYSERLDGKEQSGVLARIKATRHGGRKDLLRVEIVSAPDVYIFDSRRALVDETVLEELFKQMGMKISGLTRLLDAFSNLTGAINRQDLLQGDRLLDFMAQTAEDPRNRYLLASTIVKLYSDEKTQRSISMLFELLQLSIRGFIHESFNDPWARFAIKGNFVTYLLNLHLDVRRAKRHYGLEIGSLVDTKFINLISSIWIDYYREYIRRAQSILIENGHVESVDKLREAVLDLQHSDRYLNRLKRFTARVQKPYQFQSHDLDLGDLWGRVNSHARRHLRQDAKLKKEDRDYLSELVRISARNRNQHWHESMRQGGIMPLRTSLYRIVALDIAEKKPRDVILRNLGRMINFRTLDKITAGAKSDISNRTVTIATVFAFLGIGHVGARIKMNLDKAFDVDAKSGKHDQVMKVLNDQVATSDQTNESGQVIRRALVDPSSLDPAPGSNLYDAYIFEKVIQKIESKILIEKPGKTDFTSSYQINPQLDYDQLQAIVLEYAQALYDREAFEKLIGLKLGPNHEKYMPFKKEDVRLLLFLILWSDVWHEDQSSLSKAVQDLLERDVFGKELRAKGKIAPAFFDELYKTDKLLSDPDKFGGSQRTILRDILVTQGYLPPEARYPSLFKDLGSKINPDTPGVVTFNRHAPAEGEFRAVVQPLAVRYANQIPFYGYATHYQPQGERLAVASELLKKIRRLRAGELLLDRRKFNAERQKWFGEVMEQFFEDIKKATVPTKEKESELNEQSWKSPVNLWRRHYWVASTSKGVVGDLMDDAIHKIWMHLVYTESLKQLSPSQRNIILSVERKSHQLSADAFEAFLGVPNPDYDRASRAQQKAMRGIEILLNQMQKQLVENVGVQISPLEGLTPSDEQVFAELYRQHSTLQFILGIHTSVINKQRHEKRKPVRLVVTDAAREKFEGIEKAAGKSISYHPWVGAMDAIDAPIRRVSGADWFNQHVPAIFFNLAVEGDFKPMRRADFARVAFATHAIKKVPAMRRKLTSQRDKQRQNLDWDHYLILNLSDEAKVLEYRKMIDDYIAQLMKKIGESSPRSELRSVDPENGINGLKKTLSGVSILNAGGTIDMSGKTSRKTAGGVASLMQQVSGMVAFQEKIFKNPPDSSNIGPADWEVIIERVKLEIEGKKAIIEQLRNAGEPIDHVGGIVITHGTDTLTETALLLSLELDGSLPFPIVMTGSFAPADVEGSDALSNLAASIKLAQRRDVPNVVYVLIGSEVHLGSLITKIRTEPSPEGSYFVSYGDDNIGVVDDQGNTSLKERFTSWVESKLEALSTFNIQHSNHQKFGYVEHIIVDAFTPAEVLRQTSERIIRHSQKTGIRSGLVIQGNFVHNKEIIEIGSIMKEMSNQQIPVLLGSLDSFLHQAVKDTNAILIPKNMTHPKARTKLSWLLHKGVPYEKLKEDLPHDFVDETGEFVKFSDFPQWLQSEAFPPNDFRQDREVVKAFPGMIREVVQDPINRLLKNSDASKKELLIYGFGDGNLPLVNESVQNIVFGYLSNKIPEILDLLKRELGESALANLPLADSKKNWDLKRILEYAISNLSDQIRLQIVSAYHVSDPSVITSELISEATAGFDVGVDEKLAAIRGFLSQHFPGWAGGLENTTKMNEVVKYLNQKISTLSSSELSSLFARFPKALAQRIIKDALMAAHPILYDIGGATEKGIHIKILTNAVFGKTDLSLYELGNMLMAVGADGQKSKGWKNALARKHSQSRAIDRTLIEHIRSRLGSHNFESHANNRFSHAERATFNHWGGLHIFPSQVLLALTLPLSEAGVRYWIGEENNPEQYLSSSSTVNTLYTIEEAPLVIYLEAPKRLGITQTQLEDAAKVIKEYLEDRFVGDEIEQETGAARRKPGEAEDFPEGAYRTQYLERMEAIFADNVFKSELRSENGIPAAQIIADLETNDREKLEAIAEEIKSAFYNKAKTGDSSLFDKYEVLISQGKLTAPHVLKLSQFGLRGHDSMDVSKIEAELLEKIWDFNSNEIIKASDPVAALVGYLTSLSQTFKEMFLYFVKTKASEEMFQFPDREKLYQYNQVVVEFQNLIRQNDFESAVQFLNLQSKPSFIFNAYTKSLITGDYGFMKMITEMRMLMLADLDPKLYGLGIFHAYITYFKHMSVSDLIALLQNAPLDGFHEGAATLFNLQARFFFDDRLRGIKFRLPDPVHMFESAHVRKRTLEQLEEADKVIGGQYQELIQSLKGMEVLFKDRSELRLKQTASSTAPAWSRSDAKSEELRLEIKHVNISANVKGNIVISFEELKNRSELREAILADMSANPGSQIEFSVVASEFDNTFVAERAVEELFPNADIFGKQSGQKSRLQLYTRDRLGVGRELSAEQAYNILIDRLKHEFNAKGVTTRIVAIGDQQLFVKLTRRDIPKLLSRAEAIQAAQLLISYDDSFDFRSLGDVIDPSRELINSLMSTLLNRAALGKAA